MALHNGNKFRNSTVDVIQLANNTGARSPGDILRVVIEEQRAVSRTAQLGENFAEIFWIRFGDTELTGKKQLIEQVAVVQCVGQYVGSMCLLIGSQANQNTATAQ